MADQQIDSFVDTIWDDTFKKYKDENPTSLGKETRASPVIESDAILEKQKPFFSNLLSTAFSGNNEKIRSEMRNEMMSDMEAIFRRVLDEREETRLTEIRTLKTSINDKLLDLNIINDRLDASNRQDNLLLIGYEEPSKNYT